MPTIISGDAATAATQAILANRRKLDMEDQIFLLEPSAAPLTVILNAMGRESVMSPKYEWLQSEATPTFDRVNNGAGYTAGATSIVVDNGPYFFNHVMARVQRTGEVFKVTSISTNTLTVIRGYGSTAAAAMVDNDQISILGGAAREDDTSESSRQVKKTREYNFTQIARDPFGGSATLIASGLYGGEYLSVEANERGIEHSKYVEMALLFGERNADASLAGTFDDEATPRRTVGGVDEHISTYSTDFGGAMSLESLYDFAEDAFRYGSDVKELVCGRPVSSNISLLAADKLQTVPADKTFGIAISRLKTPHGDWNVISHKLMQGDEYSLRGYSIDMKNLEYVYLQTRDTTLNTNIQENDRDGQKNEFLTEFGLKRKLEKTFAKMTNGAV